MEDLATVVEWSRAQFALTACYHWLFVPLTLGLAVIVGVMETIYYRTRSAKWLAITKFWMTLFGINFAMGVATGIILEFEFGTNWSNYSWFVGDIFGAPLAIEGILAFFMESTFIVVMFFGWKKVSPGFHLASTWLTMLGATISAAWILIANAWMQYPVGMRFDPEQMRNVMDNFGELVFNSVPVHKFFHTVFSGWTLAGVFVIGVSCWMLWRKRNREFAMRSIKVATWVGAVGIIVTMWTGDGSAYDVARVQPMKLAAMEGVYDGNVGQSLTVFGILNGDKQPLDKNDTYHMQFEVDGMLSYLANRDINTFVPGINDLITGMRVTPEGDTVFVESIADRIEQGKVAIAALKTYNEAKEADDEVAMAQAAQVVEDNFASFGYGYLNDPVEAVPPVATTFYAFHIMIILGGYLILFFAAAFFMAYWKPRWFENGFIQWVGMLSVIAVWICSQSGWVTAEVGRQPWLIEGILPRNAAVSMVQVDNVVLTFWLFAALFTVLLVAEVSIMVKTVKRKGGVEDYELLTD